MIVRSKAPLRLGLAGGGTDVSPYSDLYGGCILNATINLYARASISENEKEIVIQASDIGLKETYPIQKNLPINKKLDLAKGVYNRLVNEFDLQPRGFHINTFVEAPPGSGLGSSSTLVVAILGAFVEWLKLPLGEYDIARLAYSIEREDLALAGGKQDQYAATFGGFNFMEFYKDEKVIVNPLRIKQRYRNELQHNLLLLYTGTSRESANIIHTQSSNVQKSKHDAIEATHQIKKSSLLMKEAILTGKIDKIGNILHQSWQYKKQMAIGITNSHIDQLYQTAIKHGANGGKISGAGGGGYMFFYCPKNTKYRVKEAFDKMGIQTFPFEFTVDGLYSYTI